MAKRRPNKREARLKIPIKELGQFLMDIETGKIALRPLADPNDVYCGLLSYKASNGWIIVIFNDCNQFDYIHAMYKGAKKVSCMDLDGTCLDGYKPTDEVIRSRYGINIGGEPSENYKNGHGAICKLPEE